MPLSERVYCVAITFKITERVEQQMCIQFCIKLEHCSVEMMWMIQKAKAIGNCDWLHQDNAPSHASRLPQSLLEKHEITQMTQLP